MGDTCKLMLTIPVKKTDRKEMLGTESLFADKALMMACSRLSCNVRKSGFRNPGLFFPQGARNPESQ